MYKLPGPFGKKGNIRSETIVNFACSLFLFTLLFLLQGCIGNNSPEPFMIELNEMTDPRDGQTYKIVKIGDQWWMAENLNYYTPAGSWYYNNDSLSHAETYGRLYSWETAMAGQKSPDKPSGQVRGISPPGWHIPSAKEWEQLIKYLDKYDLDGNALKLAETKFWRNSKTATNKSGFSAVPGGTVSMREKTCSGIHIKTRFLTSATDKKYQGILGFGLNDNSAEILKVPLELDNGWSLRCVRD